MSSLSGLGIGPFSALEARPQAVILGSGAVIEFISVIFFVLYNRTVRQLNSSHEKLVQLQDVILALRAAQSISKEHLGLYNETMRHLAEMLMVSRRSPVEAATITGGAGAQESTNGAAGGARSS